MLNAKEASRMIEELSPEQRLQALVWEVSEQTRNALDSAVYKAVASYKRKVDITLDAHICRDADAKITDLLRAMWYQDIKVTSDFPGYNESYTGRTFIKFSF